ncbi:MAG: hypothetical protein V7695_19630 [Sulfitobacter sp.]
MEKKAEAATGLSGHGSRKKIGKILGITSKTIREGEQSGFATPKMVKTLLDYIDKQTVQTFEPFYGVGGRWNASRCIGGVYVTHVARPLAFTAFFRKSSVSKLTSPEELCTSVTAYDDMSDCQLSELVSEACEIAAKILWLSLAT